MEKNSTNRLAQIEVLFRKYSDRILNYIRSRVNCIEEAENIAQDVWMRIIDSDVTICVDTVLSYLYKIASNLVNDYLRTLYSKKGVHEEIMKNQPLQSNISPEDDLCVKQISALEAQRIECLPKQRRIIYTMSRFEDKSVADIADLLSLSFRTVENHLRMGRKDVREYIAAIA